MICSFCSTDLPGSQPDAAYLQHAEACIPLQELVAKFGEAGLQHALLFGSGAASQLLQQSPDAVTEAIAAESCAPAMKAVRQMRASTHGFMHGSVMPATFKSLVS